MKKIIVFPLSASLLFLIPSHAFAGAAMMKRRQQQQQRIQVQRQMQLQLQRQIQLKQMEALRSRAQQEAQQQAAQAVVAQQKRQIQKAMVEKAAVERQIAVAQQQAAQQVMKAQQYTMQQAAMAHQAAIAQQQAVQQAMIQKGATQKAVAQTALQAKMYEILEEDNAQVEDVVTLDELIRSLDQDAQAWSLIIDAEAKQAIVSYYIHRFQQQGIYIRKPALFYAVMIDNMSETAPQMLEQRFEDILKIAAIIEYDFDNGQNKDDLARKVLGPEEFHRNRARLQNR